tara:strand:+ start:137 stop:355 length:219 start_codon:yes stop_codon:yes gene_type:complete
MLFVVLLVLRWVGYVGGLCWASLLSFLTKNIALSRLLFLFAWQQYWEETWKNTRHVMASPLSSVEGSTTQLL